MACSGKPAWTILAAVLAAGAFAVGCGSTPKAEPDPQYQALTEPSTRAPADEIERQVLAQLPELAGSTETEIQGASVRVGEPYYAASGRTCRRVAIRGEAGERHRLACVIGEAWAYVPDVVGPQLEGDQR